MNEAFGILPELWRLAGADPAVFESAKQAPRRTSPPRSQRQPRAAHRRGGQQTVQ